jgi:cell division protein ZapA
MGQVTLRIAGRDHPVACRDGEEPHLKRLAAMLDSHSESAIRASGGVSGERTLLYIALIVADLLDEAERNPPEGVSPRLLEHVAIRLEAVAAALEEEPETS